MSDSNLLPKFLKDNRHILRWETPVLTRVGSDLGGTVFVTNLMNSEFRDVSLTINQTKEFLAPTKGVDNE